MMRYGKARAFLATIVLLTATAACSSSAAPAPTASASGAAAAASTASTPAKAFKIGVSVPDVQGPFFLAMLYGIFEEAKAQGAQVILLDAGGYGNLDKQISQMEDLISQKVDGILLDPIDDAALQPVVTKAVAAGIPVVGAGDPVGGQAASQVTTDHAAVGKAMGDWVVKNITAGTYIGLSGPAGANWSTTRWKAFKEVLDGAGWTMLAEQNSDPSRDLGLKLAEDLLQRFPNATLMYAADNTIGLGAADALRAANLAGKIKLVTVVVDEDTKKAVKDGVVTMVVAQQTVKVGRDSVTALLKAMRKESVERSIGIEPVIVTKDNVDSLDYTPIAQPAGWTPNS